jgi:hypothetical protein
MCVLPAAAEDYDFELGLTYSQQQEDYSEDIGSIGSLLPTGTFQDDRETDSYTLLGTWFYSGLRDVEGPRSRAAFLGRTSGLSLWYENGEEIRAYTYSNLTPPVPDWVPSNGTFDNDITAFGAHMRHVWADSGWYGLAGASRLDHEGWARGDRWEIGVGKYLAPSTALDLRIVEDDEDFVDRTSYGLNFSHIGALPGGWQYGSDLTFEYANEVDDYQKYGVALSLFPTNDLEFGLTYHDAERLGNSDDDIGAFASWFLRDNIELRAQYVSHEPAFADEVLDYDNNTFNLGMQVRF